MTALQLTPVVISLLVLAAHFLRGGSLLLTVLILALVPLLAVRRPWAARAAQVVLALGALEWLRTLFLLTSIRSRAGEPYLRMTLILAAVASVALLSAILFETETLRRRFRLGGGDHG